MDDLEELLPPPAPTPSRPLLGHSILVAEDSRLACEAIRLLCLRSGARLRRAHCLAAAYRHLNRYRPTILIADLGLPDGSGLDLLHDLAQARPRLTVLLGMSGDPMRETEAMQAGADGFLAKPIESLAGFQKLLLSHLPPGMKPAKLQTLTDDRIVPDPIAYQDDIAHACEMLNGQEDERTLDYLLQFTRGVARSARDKPLIAVAERLARHRACGRPVGSDLARLAGILHERLTAGRAMI